MAATDYRLDLRLPGLGPASDEEWVVDRLAEALGEPVLGATVEPVSYRPGSHCVWRYLLHTPSGEPVLYAKALERDCFDRTVRHLPFLASRELVPRTVAVWPRQQVVISAAVPGRTVSSVLGDPGAPPGGRVRLARRLGDLLARFHEVRDVGAPPFSPRDQVDSVAGTVAAVRASGVEQGRRLSALLDGLAASAPEAGPAVLAHGGFRAGQVVHSPDDRLVALDVDGLCRCDRGRDLGTALAHLRWQGVRLPAQQPVLRAAERALLRGYQARAGVVDPDALLWWWAAGQLQVAARRYRRLEVENWPAVPALLDDAAEMLEALGSRRSGDATDLHDPVRMSVLLRPALARFTSSGRVQVDKADPLPSASGRRATVRYRVRELAGDGPVLVVGKCFTDSRRARLLHEHLRLLHAGPFGHGALRVPEPLGFLPEQRLVLYRHCEGTALDRVRSLDRAAEGVRRAARWLARLHGSDVSLPRTLDLTAEADSTRAWAAVVGRVCPELALNAEALAAEWAEAARGLPAVAEVPIHKDFHPGHVVLGEATWVIDLDEARLGDPTYDIAHFCAYLGLTFEPPTSDLLVDVFLSEYDAAAGRPDRGSPGPYLAYTWLKIAKQWAMRSGPCRDASPAKRATGAAVALERGWTCLSESSTSCAAGLGSRRRSS